MMPKAATDTLFPGEDAAVDAGAITFSPFQCVMDITSGARNVRRCVPLVYWVLLYAGTPLTGVIHRRSREK
jgi:hypothetical protein